MPLPLFQNIFGQDEAITWISQACRAERLPHGLIFAGPSGVGKAAAAAALAALYLCHHPDIQAAAPCGKCDSCRLFAAGTHPDFASIYRQLVRLDPKKKDAAARDLVVDVIRDHLVAPANLKPALGRGRVFIVEEAELMNAAAQNCLLKTLEEPFDRTLIILLSDQAQSLLPTIQSRTQTIRFHALETRLVARELERRGVDGPTALFAAQLSEGSIGQAMRWIADDVIPAARQLRSQIDELLAGRPPQALADWFKTAAEAYAKKQSERDDKTSADQAKREGRSQYLRIAGQRFRQVLRDSADPAALDRACSAIEAIAQADDYLQANVNISLVFQQLAQTLFRLAA